jgi:ADP-ribose pyrophosphatase
VPLGAWKKLRQITEVRNPWWTYRHDEVLLPNGRLGAYHYVHVLGSSMILPVTEDGRIVLVNQYRYLAGRESLEFPCGSVKEGSSHDETARLELAEETGFQARHIRSVGEFNPYNGVTDEMCRVYIARELVPVSAHRDETEEFEQAKLTVAEIEQAISSGRMWDGMSLAAWALVKHLIPG